MVTDDPYRNALLGPENLGKETQSAGLASIETSILGFYFENPGDDISIDDLWSSGEVMMMRRGRNWIAKIPRIADSRHFCTSTWKEGSNDVMGDVYIGDRLGPLGMPFKKPFAL